LFGTERQTHRVEPAGEVVGVPLGGGQVFREVMERIQRAYGWDSLDKPTLR